MKKVRLALSLLVLLGLVACNTEKKVELDPIKRGFTALDAQYAAQDAYMQNGAEMTDSIVVVLTKALDSWPDNTDDNCKAALSLELSHWAVLAKNEKLSDSDKGPMPDTSKLSEFRYQCRTDINYVHDKKRSHDVWAKLVAN